MKISILILGLFLGLTVQAEGGKCQLHVTREAGPGHESDSYKKCKGEKSCTEEPTANSLVECAKAAMIACENARFRITKSKSIFASFGDVKLRDGKDFCNPKSSEFNKCDK